MNIFGKSLEEIHAENSSLVEGFDLLPGVPNKLSVKDTACVLGVSVQTIQRMINANELPLTSSGDILKSELISYISCHTLADIPILDSTESPEYPTISRKNPDQK
ncbi:MAG: helix-turn-helix domain-containing protein [Treponema sp.]|nr:helix-turn-helix domain-containing protein [Treponema sp.]